jgi:orotidine-5'-phosphate decarboxylase
MPTFAAKIDKAWSHANSMLCVGLDPDRERFPPTFKGPRAIYRFNRMVIDATADLVCAYKPQIAYYSACAAETDLELTIAYIRARAPHALVILDAKRGDIASTAAMYAREAFDRYDADAVTVNPFMGMDCVEPFLERPNRAAILLCKTSNPGSSLIQHQRMGQRLVYETIAELAEQAWKKSGNAMILVGATFVEEMLAIRKIAPTIPFLVPGIGQQQGDVRKVLENGTDATGRGLVISSSRSITYAGDGGTAAVRAAATETAEKIRLAATAPA